MPPRPGPRIVVGSAPARQRPDLIAAIDTDEHWHAMLSNRDERNRTASGQPDRFTIANGCYYGTIPTGRNTGLALLHGFWKADKSGYPTIRVGRMCGWHTNYSPGTSSGRPAVSGKSPGPIATGDRDLSGIEVGRGGNVVTGLGGYSCRQQRGIGASTGELPATSPLSSYLAIGDYNYFMSGLTHGGHTFGVVPVPRMTWVWIETVHATNSVHENGTWERDGVYELHVDGRKYCESRRLEYRVAGNPALWDAMWFNEYNGGTEDHSVDRPWPFVVGPTYIVSGDAPIAPPANWRVAFVDEHGRPGSALAYAPR